VSRRQGTAATGRDDPSGSPSQGPWAARAAPLARLDQAELLLFDGTFWTDDELARLDISDRPALSMGHVPISGAEGSLAALRQLSCRQKVYTHINNTNPMLIEGSMERAAVEAAGMLVGMDGMHFEI